MKRYAVQSSVTGPCDQFRIPDETSDAAQDWFLRLQAAHPSATDRACFKAWYDADPRHRAAYEEVRELWAQLGDLEPACAPWGLAQPDQHRRSFVGRRLGVAVAGLVATCILLLVLVPTTARLPTRLLADYSTAVGEQRMVMLPDGSTAYLNTDTAIDLAFADGRRVVKLLYGEAMFEVRKEERPFDVVALDGRITALGTAFAVGIASDTATVTVTEGVVRVVPIASAAEGAGTLVEASQRVSYRQGRAAGPVSTLDANAAMSWRWGAIHIPNQPLDQALAEIGRYRAGRIMLLGSASRYVPITARLTLADLDGGIDALAATHGLTVMRLTDYLLIIR